MFCSECGKKIEIEEKYCSNCGKEIFKKNLKNEIIFKTSKNSNFKKSVPANKLLNFFVVSFILILLLLMFGGAYFGIRHLIEGENKHNNKVEVSTCDFKSKYTIDGYEYVLKKDPNTENSDISIVPPSSSSCEYRIRINNSNFIDKNNDIIVEPDKLEEFFDLASNDSEHPFAVKIGQNSLQENFDISFDVNFSVNELKDSILKYINNLKPQSKITFRTYGYKTSSNSINVEYLESMYNVYKSEYSRTKQRMVYIKDNYLLEEQNMSGDINSNNKDYIKSKVFDFIDKHIDDKDSGEKFLFNHLDLLNNGKEDVSYIIITDGFFNNVKGGYDFTQEGYDNYINNYNRREYLRGLAFQKRKNATSSEAADLIKVLPSLPSFNFYIKSELEKKINIIKANICFELVDLENKKISTKLLQEKLSIYNNFICNNN